MAVCSSCGSVVTQQQKFCRTCGVQVNAAQSPDQEPRPRTCSRCGQPVAMNARFCRGCGGVAEATPAQPQPSVPAARSRKPVNVAWAIPVVAIVCVAVFAGGFFWWTRGSSEDVPDATIVQSAVAQGLPSFVRLATLTVGDMQRDASSTTPSVNAPFTAAVVLTAPIYKQSRVDGDVMFLTQQASAGAPVELSGAVQLHQQEGQWQPRVSFAQHPLFNAAPREAFTNVRTIVEGSAEQQSFDDARAREAASAQAAEAARVAAEQERVRLEAEARRLEAERQAQARRQAELAEAERARLAREAQVRADIAEQERVAAERQRAEQAQRAQAEAEEARRRESERAMRGSIPRGTQTTVRLTSRLRSDAVRVEDRFETITTEDIVVDGRVVVPAGSTLRGIVASVQQATQGNRNAKLDLRFDLLTIGSHSFPIRARATKVLTSSGMRNDAVKAGVGAAAGAVIGAILGGGKGAAIGAGVGGGGTFAVSDGSEVDLAPGSTLRIAFDSAIDFQ